MVANSARLRIPTVLSISRRGGPERLVQRASRRLGEDAHDAVGGIDRRQFISDIEADVPRLAYNYTVEPAVAVRYDVQHARRRWHTTHRHHLVEQRQRQRHLTSVSNDVIDIRPNGGNLQVTVNAGNKTAGIDPLSPITSNFPIASVQRISINAGDGNDFVRLFSNPNNVPITLTGGVGTDTLEGHGATNAYDNSWSARPAAWTQPTWTRPPPMYSRPSAYGRRW